ncbi:hypothetical protein [Agaribacter flavus]|uniref:Uncharacterized protein n=1 Tax=Agaribacter flavus TaxID=1902781 RepID=A0ABV7FRC5_9ALTE
MKTSQRIVISVTSVIVTFVAGVVVGKQIDQYASQAHDVADVSTSVNAPAANSPAIESVAQLSTKVSTASLPSSSDVNEDILLEINELLVQIKESPSQMRLSLELFTIFDTLSVEQLLNFGELLSNYDERERTSISSIIIAQLLEKAPEEVLGFMQKHSHMAGSPFYVDSIRAQVAKKKAELGFDYLNNLLYSNAKDVNMRENMQLLAALAKTNISRVVDVLLELTEKGVELDNSLIHLSFDLNTSEEHRELFNQLRRFDDMSLLGSVFGSWIELSPMDVFDRLNQIENINEREKLTETALFYWSLRKPEAAANYRLTHASNKLETVKDIMRTWPNEKATEALEWLSQQSDIDSNYHKISYLRNLSYLEPEFVEAHLNDIQLSDDQKIDFYKQIYQGYQRKSSTDAEQFAAKLPFGDQIIDKKEEPIPAEDLVSKINRIFERYYDYKYDKAFALAMDDKGGYAYSFVVNKASQDEANALALQRCEQHRKKHNVDSRCQIYAEGDMTLFNLAP